MPDLERIGGVTGWLGAATLAAERGIKMSSHLYSETSAHLLAVTPTAHFLEYVDWADKIVQEPLQIVDGEAVIPDRPGTGMVWTWPRSSDIGSNLRGHSGTPRSGGPGIQISRTSRCYWIPGSRFQRAPE